MTLVFGNTDRVLAGLEPIRHVPSGFLSYAQLALERAARLGSIRNHVVEVAIQSVFDYAYCTMNRTGNSRTSAPKSRTTGSNAKKAASGGGGESDPEPERQTQLNPMTVILDAVRLSEVTMTRPCPSAVLTLARIASLPVCGGAQ